MALISQHKMGIVLLIGATLAWSTAGLFARAITLDVATLTLWRGLFGAAGLLAVLLWMKGLAGLRDFANLGRAGLVYSAVSGIGMLLFMGALKETTIAHVAIIYATIPFVAGAIGWIALREVPGRAAVVAAGVALAGSVLMVGLGGDGRLLGDLLSVGMVISMGILIVIARARPNLPALAAGTLSAVLAPALCIPFASLEIPAADQMWLLAGFGLFNTTIGFALFIYGSRYLPPIETALISALETPMTPFWVWLIFAETPTGPTLMGGALVMAAVVGHIVLQWRAEGAAPPPASVPPTVQPSVPPSVPH